MFNSWGLNLEFEEKSIFNGQVTLKLPVGLEILAPEKARLKYPSVNRPDLILTTQDGLVNITFKHSRIPFDETEIGQFQNRMITTIQKKQPRVSWQGVGVKKINGGNIGFCNFTVPAVDTSVYNLMFFAELNHRVLISTVNCPIAQMEYWKPIAVELMETMKITSSNEDSPAKLPAVNYTDYQFKLGFYASYHDKEYRVFQLADGNYRLISSDPRELADGFEKKDGIYKKTVSYADLQTFYELKTKVIYKGQEFELDEVFQNEVQLIKKNCNPVLARQLQLQKSSLSGEYEKLIARSEIEDVIEEKRSIK